MESYQYEPISNAIEFKAHTQPVNQCRYLNNDSAVVTCSDDGSVCFWEICSGINLLKLSSLHSREVKAIDIDDQKFHHLLSASWDKSAIVTDYNTLKSLFHFFHDSLCTSCHINKRNSTAAIGCDNNVLHLWDIRSGEKITDTKTKKGGHSNSITNCKFSHDGLSLCSTSLDMSAIIWDLRTMKPLLRLSGHTNAVSSCSFSSDDHYLCTSSWDKTVRVYDISTGTYRSKEVPMFKDHEGCVSGCEFSRDSPLLASCGYDGLIYMYNTRTEGKVCSMKGYDSWALDIHISADNRWLLSCSKDGFVKVLDTESNELIIKKTAGGLVMAKCDNCGRMFTDISIPDSSSGLCVFCRIDSPQRSLEHILAPLH